jgi:hypothetical protein
MVIVLAAGFALADANVTGKWSGSFNASDPNGDSKESTAIMVLKQTGSDITGTVGPNDDEQFEIRKGKIEGDKITLEVEQEGHTLTFNLVLAADRITGEARLSRDGQTRTAKIDVTRAK